MIAVVFVSSVQNPEESIQFHDHGFDPVQENEIANDFDLIALESAVSLKEQGVFDEVVVLSLAPRSSHLLKSLAMGADRAIWCQADYHQVSPPMVVDTALKAICERDEVIWFLGKLGVNHESHMTAQILAARLNVPCLCSVCHIECQGDKWLVQCEDDHGIPTFELHAPFVVAADLRLAEPRFPSLPNIVKARRKPIIQIDMPSRADGWYSTQSLKMAQDAHRHCQMIDIDVLRHILEESCP